MIYCSYLGTLHNSSSFDLRTSESRFKCYDDFLKVMFNRPPELSFVYGCYENVTFLFSRPGVNKYEYYYEIKE